MQLDDGKVATVNISCDVVGAWCMHCYMTAVLCQYDYNRVADVVGGVLCHSCQPSTAESALCRALCGEQGY